MDIRGRELEECSVFELEGSLDLHSVHDLKNLFLHLKNQNKNVIFDFSAVKTIDSSGIGCLMFGQKLLANNEKKIKITNLNPRVRIIFQITRGFEVFEIFDELDRAISSTEISKRKAA